MKWSAFVAILLSCAASAQPGPEFAKWWPGFQAAVAKRDAHTVAQGVRFPLDWENGPRIRQTQSESDLAGHFNAYFTSEIKKQIAGGKPERLPNGNYLIVWDARGNEYSLNFGPDSAGF